MQLDLRYGNGASLGLEIDDTALVADYSQPRVANLADPGAETLLALASPLDFPSLDQAVTPGDMVTIAIGGGVPRAAALVRSLVDLLLRCGVSADSIVVLRSPANVQRGAEDPCAELPPEVRGAVQSLIHDANDRSLLAYLAATADARPIYLNRALCDADLVIPIAAAQSGPADGAYGGGLYPTFSNQETQKRYRNPLLRDADSEVAARARSEANEVAWLLGLLFAIQVAPGADAGIAAVLAGSYESVCRRARELLLEIWDWPIEARASLVVAAVDGGAPEQTWENIGRALAAANRAVVDEGAIAIVSDLAGDPGLAIQMLAEIEDRRAALAEIKKQRPDDLVPAIQLAKAAARAQVYLLSHLDETLVERLGLARVDEAQDVARLARRHRSCTVLGSAQHGMPRVTG
jgi:nickel-dependent lactate racemase